MARLHDLCRYVQQDEATARFSLREREGDVSVRLDVVLTVTLQLVCSACEKSSAQYVTVSAETVLERAAEDGWRTANSEMLCEDCYTEYALSLLPAETQAKVVRPTDLAYHRGSGGNGQRGGVVVTGRVVGHTANGDEMLEEFVTVNGIVQRETIARSYLERVTRPISQEEAQQNNPHLITLVKQWVRKQIYHVVDAQEYADRLAMYTFYQHRTRPEYIRATDTFIRRSDGSGVAEIFYMEHRKLVRRVVGQSIVDEHFVPISLDEALQHDKSLVVQLDRFRRRAS